MYEVGKRIKQRREELAISQDQLAEELGYKSRSTIAKIEAGVNDIPTSKIHILAKVLNVSVSWLLGLEVVVHEIYVLERENQRIQTEIAKNENTDITLLERQEMIKLRIMELKHEHSELVKMNHISQYNEREESSLIEIYRSLNENGRSEAKKRISELTEISRYTDKENF